MILVPKTHTKMIQDQSGYVVLITILILGAATTVIVGFLLLTGQNSSIASNSVAANAGNKAAASACAQLALSTISANPSSPSPLSYSQAVSSSQTCGYVISGSSPNFTINASGVVQQGQRSFTHRLQLTIDQVSPKINVSRWADVP